MSSLSLRLNTAALTAQRSLDRATDQMVRSYERVSSGSRLNRGSDDAASLAVADRLRSDRRLLTQARRNVDDGISTLTIADSALAEQSSILSRALELATQAANGTLSSTQRLTLDQQYQELIAEFGRIGDSIAFNGLNLLRGDRGVGELVFQAGINGRSDSRIAVRSVDSGRYSGTFDADSLVIDLTGDGTTYGPDGGITIDDSLFFTSIATSGTSLDDLSQFFNNNLISVRYTDSNGREREGVIVIAGSVADSGGTVTFNLFTKSLTDDRYYGSTIGGSTGFLNSSPYTINSTTGEISGASSVGGAIVNADGSTANLQFDFSGIRILGGASKTAIDLTGIENVFRARDAITTLSNRLELLSSLRGQLGASQSRLSTAMNLLINAGDVTASAESRLRDADVASEATQLIRTKLLQEVSASILAQAGQSPNLILQLLR